MPDYDFRTMLFSNRGFVAYDMASLSQLNSRGAPMVLHNTSIQSLAGAANGFAVRTQGPNACIEIPDLQITTESDIHFYAFGFRIYIPDVPNDKVFCFLNLGSPDNITDGNSNEGMYFFYWTPSVADPSLGSDGREFGFRLYGINAIDTDDTNVRMSSSPVLTAGWHDIVLQMRQLNDLTDASVWLDGSLYNFDVNSGGLSNWCTGTRDGYLGVNRNTALYTGVLEVFFDNFWTDGEPRFWTGQNTTFNATQMQAIRDSQYISMNSPPVAAALPYVFDADRSGPLDADSGTLITDDELRLSGVQRRWVTGVVKQAIPLGTGKYTCTFQVTNDVGWSTSNWEEMWENVVAGVVGDQTFNLLPVVYTGSWGPHVGTILPSLGIWMKGGAGQPYLYRNDFTLSSSGDETSSVPAPSNQKIEVVFDSGTKQVDVYVGNGCSPLLAASYVVDFEDQYARFAVSIRSPLNTPTEPGIKVLTDPASCDPDAELPGANQAQGVLMRLPDGVTCVGAQKWVDLLVAANHIYNPSLTNLPANTQDAIDQFFALYSGHLGVNPVGQTHRQIEDELVRLEQVKLDILDALQVFSFAAYGSLDAPPDSPFPNLGGAWQKIDILTVLPFTGRGITLDPVNSTFSFDYDGVYFLMVSGSFEHNSSNQGRTTQARLFNETTGTGMSGVVIGTGRNAEATPVTGGLLVEVTEAQKGDVFSLQIGNGDTYTAVSFASLGIDIHAVSEWREPISGVAS